MDRWENTKNTQNWFQHIRELTGIKLSVDIAAQKDYKEIERQISTGSSPPLRGALHKKT